MNITNMVKAYCSDFFMQSAVFYITIISPIGVLPYYIAGNAGTSSLLWDEFYYLNKYFSFSRLLETFWRVLISMPLYSMLLSAPLSIANIYTLNIYIYKIRDGGYLLTKILFLTIAVVLFVPYWLIIGDYHTVLYSSFPAILTCIFYLLFNMYKENKKEC